MLQKKECVAMLLAGGRGSRLAPLTDYIAKPAVSFGARYKIIDFSLSNCVNSGIDTVGVLTQYQPLELNDFLGTGAPWDLDLTYGGLHVLPPYQSNTGGGWFKGTANAIYQNLKFIKRYDPEYVVILSGDHIYKMNYAIMLNEHKQNNADCTIAVIDVPIEEASRFGIMNTDSVGRITEFEEKPQHPKSTQASMGVYIFSTDKLVQYLEADEKSRDSQNDFGKNVIPAMLEGGERLFAYLYKGYWRDVGTLQSFWATNMDAVGDKPKLWLNDAKWRIHYKHDFNNPQYVGNEASITNSICGDGNDINGRVDSSVIFSGIRIESGAIIRDSIVMRGSVIKSGAVVEYSILDEDTIIERGARVGTEKSNGDLTVIGRGVRIGEGIRIRGGEILTESKIEEGL